MTTEVPAALAGRGADADTAAAAGGDTRRRRAALALRVDGERHRRRELAEARRKLEACGGLTADQEAVLAELTGAITARLRGRPATRVRRGDADVDRTLGLFEADAKGER